MKKAILSVFVVIILVVLLSCTGKTGSPGPIGPAGPQQSGLYYIKNFQNGVYPASYGGQIEASIFSGYSAATYTANIEPIWLGRIAANLNVNRGLMKFDLSSLPSSKILIDKAELTIKTNGNIIGSGITGVHVHKITTFWTQYYAGWNNATEHTFWQNQYNEGGDFDSNTMTVNAAAFNLGANDTVTIDLDPAVVLSWAASPSTNYGMIFIAGDEAGGEYAEIYPSGDLTPSNRPLLKISYYTTE
jgi:hypothetical protein